MIMSDDDDDDRSSKLLRPHSPTADNPPPFSDRVLSNVLENVLQFLTCRRDRNAASLVCKNWYEVESKTRYEVFIGNCYSIDPSRVASRFPNVQSLVLKGKPRFADFSLVPFDWGAHVNPWILSFGRSCRFLEKIFLKRMSVSDDDLALIAGSFPAIKEISVVCCDGFSTAGIAAVAESCRQLRVLDLIEDYLDEDEEEGVDWITKFPQNVTCLESLVFECLVCPINFGALESLVARSPKLRQLRLNQEISAQQLKILMNRAPQLTHLGTGSFKAIDADNGIGPQALEHELESLASAFAASKNIVCLSGFRDMSLDLLPAIYPVCANLVSLNFSFAEISPERLKPVIVHCHKLQKLWVLDTVRDEGLQLVAATCRDLRELRVFPFDAREESEGLVSYIGLTAIAEGCPRLRSILYFCQKMTNAAVISMSKNCPDLVVFRLCIMGRHLPDYITGQSMDEGFGSIVVNCKKLTRLAVSGLLTDKAFAYIGQYGKLVRTLSVAFAGDSDMSLTYVLEGCKNLQKLEVRDSPWGDSGLLSGIHHYYNMRFLWMSSCGLTLRGCKEVARRLPHMVVEVIRDQVEDRENDGVGKLYMYRSLVGPRNDAPPFVEIL